MKITEQALKEKGFVLKTHSSVLKMYEKDQTIIESTFIGDWNWELRERIDSENSKYIAEVKTFEDIELHSQ